MDDAIGDRAGQVLVLEDDAGQRATLVALLEEEGFQVIACANGRRALEQLRHGVVAVAVIDLSLPDIGVQELLAGLGSLGDRVLLIINTGHGSYESAKAAANLGVWAFVEKLGDPRELLLHVHRAMRAQAARVAHGVLRESEERFRQLFDNMIAAVAVYQAVNNGEDFVFKGFNRAAERIERVAGQDLIGKRVTQVFPGIVEFGLLEVFQRVWRTGVPEYHPSSRYEDGRIQGWRENHVYRLAQGEIVAVYNDVTERKQAEEALRESEDRFRTIFDTAADGLFLRDLAAGKFHLANRACLQMLGYTLEEFQGLDIVDLHPREELPLIRAEIAKFTRGDVGARVETRFRRKDGTVFVADLNPTLVTFAGQSYALVAIHDITARKETEQRLIDYQDRLRELATRLTLAEEQERRRIAVGVHDQISQRMALVKLALQSLRASTAENDTASIVDEICKDIDAIIEDTHSLTYEMSNPVLHETGFVNAIESWLAERIRGRYGIEYAFEADPRAASVDHETGVALFQTVRELLTNVIKHAEARRVHVRIRRAGEKVEIIVRDDGIGLDPACVGKPHSQTGGYGLFSIRETLEYFGGGVSIQSARGQGTQICITVPARRAGKPEERRRHHEDSDCR